MNPNIYEIHTTVASMDFAEFSAAVEDFPGLTPLFFILQDRAGRSVGAQTMTSFHTDTLANARKASLDVCRFLERAGFPPIRTKIETTPDNPEDLAILTFPKFPSVIRYYETHVRFDAGQDRDDGLLQEIIGRHGGFPSFAPTQCAQRGTFVQHLSLRTPLGGKDELWRRARELVRDLGSWGFGASKLREEIVLMDTNYGLDSAWLSACRDG